MALGAGLLGPLHAGQWLYLPPTSTAALQLAAAFARPGEARGEKQRRYWRLFRAQLSAGVNLDRVAGILGLGKRQVGSGHERKQHGKGGGTRCSPFLGRAAQLPPQECGKECSLWRETEMRVFVLHLSDCDHPPRALCVCEAHSGRWDVQGGIHHQWRSCQKGLLHWTQ